MDGFSHCNLVTYLSNEWQNEQQMEQDYKTRGNMSKAPGLGGPLGGLCNILFPKKYDEKYMYQSFLLQSGISNKSIIHVVFITMCMNVAKEPIFIYRWNIYFWLHFCSYISWSCSSHDTRYLLKINQFLQFSAVVICNSQYDEFSPLAVFKIQHT